MSGRGWVEISEKTWERMANRAGVQMPKKPANREGWVLIPMSNRTISKLNIRMREEGQESLDEYFNDKMDESLDNFLRAL